MINEDAPVNSAGTGANVALPPAHIVVKGRTGSIARRKSAYIDGRSKAAKQLIKRLSKRKKKMSEDFIKEAAPSETERVQKNITQQKKLSKQKDLQKKREEARKKVGAKTKEMDMLLKARLSDFKKKSQDQNKKLQKAHYEPEGELMSEMTTGHDGSEVLSTIYKIAEMSGSYGQPENGYSFVQPSDGSRIKVDGFSAKKIVAAFEGLSLENKEKFRYMLNKDGASFMSVLDFAIRNA